MYRPAAIAEVAGNTGRGSPVHHIPFFCRTTKKNVAVDGR